MSQSSCQKPMAISTFVHQNYQLPFHALMDACVKEFPEAPAERIFVAIRAVYFFMKDWDKRGDFCEAYARWWQTDWQHQHIIRPLLEADIAEQEKKMKDHPEPAVEATEEEIAEAEERDKDAKHGDLPPMRKRISNLAVAFKQFAADGFELATDKTYQDRLDICAGCEHLMGGSVCTKCGCYMRIKAKLAIMKCPINKW